MTSALNQMPIILSNELESAPGAPTAKKPAMYNLRVTPSAEHMSDTKDLDCRLIKFGYIRHAFNHFVQDRDADQTPSGLSDSNQLLFDEQDFYRFRYLARAMEILAGRKMHIVQMEAGAWHVMMLLDDGSVMGLGENSNGQLGCGSRSYKSEPTPVIWPLQYHHGRKRIVVKQIGCCKLSSIFLTRDGRLFYSGNACSFTSGCHRDGYSSSNTDSLFPTQIDLFGIPPTVSMEFIACGGNQLYVKCCDDKGVFTFFDRIDEIFDPSTEGLDQDTQYNIIPVDTSSSLSHVELREIRTLRGHNIVSISAAHRHAIFCSDEGRVFTSGSSEQGQSGRFPLVNILLDEPQEVEFFQQHPGKRVFAGSNANFVLAKDGTLYHFGNRNDTNQSLISWLQQDRMWQPQVINLVGGNLPKGNSIDKTRDRLVKDVKSAKFYTMILMENGEVLGFGNPVYSFTGMYTQDDALKVCPYFHGIRVASLCQSTFFFAASTWQSNGKVQLPALFKCDTKDVAYDTTIYVQ